MQRTRKVWPIQRGGKASTENLAEETQTLDLVDNDFKSALIRVFKNLNNIYRIL